MVPSMQREKAAEVLELDDRVGLDVWMCVYPFFGAFFLIFYIKLFNSKWIVTE